MKRSLAYLFGFTLVFGIGNTHLQAHPLDLQEAPQAWAQWIEEGNFPTVVDQLEQLVTCNARCQSNKIPDPYCEHSVQQVLSYRSKTGLNLLEHYLQSAPHNTIQDIKVLVFMAHLGVNITSWADGDQNGLLWFLISRGDIERIHTLLEIFNNDRKNASEVFRSLKDDQGTTLVDRLVEEFPQAFKLGFLLIHFNMIDSYEEIKNKGSAAYISLKLQQKGEL